MDKIHIDDSFTASVSDDGSLPKRHRVSRLSLFKKKERRSSKMFIKDLSEEDQAKASKFDLDGNGILDKVELAMMRYDADGDGNLGLQEVYGIVEDHLKDKNNIGALRKVIAGLTCFVVILALSNLGTSIASAILLKDMAADTTTSELKLLNSDVMGTQSSAETFEAAEMDVDTRRARRKLVVESLTANPFGEHAHRRLAKNGDKCKGKQCDSDIAFDVNVMKQEDVMKIKSKCDLGRVVNLRRYFPGGSADTSNLCKTGTEIVIKEKKTKPRKMKGKGKSKNRIRFEMNVLNEGKSTSFDCDGANCFISGTNLLQQHGQPCNIQHGSDDCEADLVCIQDVDEPTSGKCLSSWHSATWYVDWDDHKCVQDCVGGPNCGGHASNWHEKFSTYQLCCDHHLSYLGGGYRMCVPDLDYIKEHN
jgi:hypothetical protein